MSLVAQQIRGDGRLTVRTDLLGGVFVVLAVLSWGIGMVAGPTLGALALGLIGVVAVGCGVLHPTFGMFGLAIWCTGDSVFRFFLLNSGGLPFSSFNYCLAGVALLYAPFLVRLRNWPCIVWQLFAILLAIQIPFSPNMHFGWARLLNVVAPFGMLVFFVRTSRDGRLWFWLAVVSAVVSILGVPIVYLKANQLFESLRNLFALLPLTAMYWGILACQFTEVKSRARRLLFGLALLNYVLILLTASRGTILVATICVPFMIMELRGVQARLAGVMASVFLVFLAALLFPSRVGYTVARFSRFVDGDTSLRQRTSGRYDLALGAWYIALEHPLGVGTGGFNEAWRDLELQGGMSGWGAGLEVDGGAHSAWVESLAENGFLGLLLHFAFPVSLIVEGYRKREKGLFRCALFAAVAICITYLSHNSWEKGVWVIAIGVIVLLNREEMVRALDRTLGRTTSARAQLVPPDVPGGCDLASSRP